MGLGILGGQLDGIFEFKNGFGVFAISEVGIAPLDKRHFLRCRISTAAVGKQEDADQQHHHGTHPYPPLAQHALFSLSCPYCSCILCQSSIYRRRVARTSALSGWKVLALQVEAVKALPVSNRYRGAVLTGGCT